MKNLQALILAACLAVFAAGCAPSDAAVESSGGTDSKMASATSTEMAKCDACGKEVAKTELSDHDGKMWCKACLDAHAH